MLERIGFVFVQWKASRGLSGPAPSMPEARKLKALQTGVRGETYAYWHLRRLGRPRGRHPRVRRSSHSPRGERKFALPELSITQGKHETLIRTAHYFLRERHIKECPLRFEVVAIGNTPRPTSRCSPAQVCSQPRCPSPFRLVVPRWSIASGLAYTRRPREWSFSIKESP
jgi:hypothetical protein